MLQRHEARGEGDTGCDCGAGLYFYGLAQGTLSDLIAEVLDYLVGTRPFIGRDHQVDIATTETIERPVGHATGVNAQLS